MEKTLKSLFEYQKFEQNKELAQMIAKTESKYEAALSDEELDMINAAGVTRKGIAKIPIAEIAIATITAAPDKIE